MPYPAMIWVYVNAHWNTKLVFNPMPVHSGTVMNCCCCYPALTWVRMVYLGDKQMIWVWCKVPMNTALLALETRVDAFLWFGKCIQNSLSVWMIPTKRAGLWTHMVYMNCCWNHLWVLRLELNNMYGNEWKDSDLLASNQDSFWCDSIICFDEEL